MSILNRIITASMFVFLSSDLFCADLAKGKIGPLQAGIHIFELAKYDTNADVKRVNLEGDFFLEYSFNLEGIGQIDVLLDGDDKTVYKLSTQSILLKTKKEVGVGDSFKKIKAAYPNGYVVQGQEGNSQEIAFVLPDHEGVFTFDSAKNNSSSEVPLEAKSISFFTYNL